MSRRPTSKPASGSQGKAKPRPSPAFGDDTNGEWPGVGAFAFSRTGDDHTVNWQSHDGNSRSALFSELCQLQDRAEDRREVGNLIAEIIHQFADREMQDIPGYADAVKHTAPLYRMEAEWQRWAEAPAGNELLDRATSGAKDKR